MRFGGVLRLIGLCLALGAGGCSEGYFDSAGVRIHYLEVGRGEPVVLLHGWGVDARMWRQVAAALAPQFWVIAPDLRGHGKSDKPHDPQAYGPAMAEDVVRLLDHLGIARAHLVGYSMGAILAGWLVARYPERVRSATFAGGAPILEWDPEDLKASEGFLEGWKQGWLPSLVRLLGGDPVALEAANRSLREVTVPAAALEAYGGPVLFVYGSREWASTLRYVAAARAVWGRAEGVVIPGADHFSTPARPEFASAILGFLRRAEGP